METIVIIYHAMNVLSSSENIPYKIKTMLHLWNAWKGLYILFGRL